MHTPRFLSNIFATRANLKIRSKPFPQGFNSGCFGVPRVNVALSSTWRDLENQGNHPWKNRIISAGRYNFSFQLHRDIIPTATPTFLTTADLSMTMSMSADVVDYGFKMAATKPELEITFKRYEIATRFQRLPPNSRPWPTLT